MIKVGCCGFPVSMKKYFDNLKLVEVQKTFYKPPEIKTAERWRKNAPKDFEFTVKAWQVITHPPSSPTYRKAKLNVKNAGFFKPVKEVFEAWEVTRSFAKALNANFILFQTPRSFTDKSENISNMVEFFGSIERDFLFGFEPRGWKEEKILKVCSELQLIHVVDPLQNRQLFGDISYFRLHGGANYKHKYTEEELRKVLSMCKTESYVLFNNIYMFDDAMLFKKILKNRRSRLIL